MFQNSIRTTISNRSIWPLKFCTVRMARQTAAVVCSEYKVIEMDDKVISDLKTVLVVQKGNDLT